MPSSPLTDGRPFTSLSEASSVIEKAHQRELGQFFTPAGVAEFMASLFSPLSPVIRLLDAGAGAGSLTKAFVESQLSHHAKPASIHVTVIESDKSILPQLLRTLDECKERCQKAGVDFDAELVDSDFIEYAADETSQGLFARPLKRFNAAIVNPPYRKIRSHSPEREALRRVGIETSNLYSAFIALILRLLDPSGQMVAITPRSFCNGPYFKPFRTDLLARSTLKRLHLYESRKAAFRDDNVLQENLVFHVVREKPKRTPVVISSSIQADASDRQDKLVSFGDIVHPDDPDQFIHISLTTEDGHARNLLSRLTARLADLEISVSTGRVVDFRAKEFLCSEPGDDTVPLIYPCHFSSGTIQWPKNGSRKPNAITHCEQTAGLFVPNATYVLTKRFSAKEELKRVVACLFEPGCVSGNSVGFENHLNYFHAQGGGLDRALANGLSAYLNSSVVDLYFRQFNGHTQVNATDLRNLRYPDRSQLLKIGKSLSPDSSQAIIDEVVEGVIRE